MEHTESQEMYLYAIYKLRMTLGTVREVDIAAERGYSKPSVHNALKNLAGMGLINFVPGNISLTQEGFEKASKLYTKHILIKKTLVMLGASEKSAEENACRLEHDISDDVYELIKQHVEQGEERLKMLEKQEKNK